MVCTMTVNILKDAEAQTARQEAQRETIKEPGGYTVELEDINLAGEREEDAGDRVGWRQNLPKEEERNTQIWVFFCICICLIISI